MSSNKYPECVMKVLRISLGLSETNRLHDAALQMLKPAEVVRKVTKCATKLTPEALAWVERTVDQLV